MDDPILTIEELEAINNGRCFGSRSPSLRHDILRCAYIKRYADGDWIAARGAPPSEWTAVVKGAARVSSTSLSGKQVTLTYVEPGVWFVDVAMFEGDQRTHDVYAHGTTTLFCVARSDFQKTLAQHIELYEALMRLQARRIRTLFGTRRTGPTLGCLTAAGQPRNQDHGARGRHSHRSGRFGRARPTGFDVGHRGHRLNPLPQRLS
jgi:CRP/FNR family transcriptional regulator, cyclic AMP receptor protein